MLSQWQSWKANKKGALLLKVNSRFIREHIEYLRDQRFNFRFMNPLEFLKKHKSLVIFFVFEVALFTWDIISDCKMSVDYWMEAHFNFVSFVRQTNFLIVWILQLLIEIYTVVYSVKKILQFHYNFRKTSWRIMIQILTPLLIMTGRGWKVWYIFRDQSSKDLALSYQVENIHN